MRLVTQVRQNINHLSSQRAVIFNNLKTCRAEFRQSKSSTIASFVSVRTMAANSAEASSPTESLTELWDTFLKNQQNHTQLSLPEYAKTVVQNASKGVLSVISNEASTEGYPSASIVEYAADDDGLPILSMSDLAPHTKYARNDGRVSFMITEKADLSIEFPRVTMMGLLEEITADTDRLRDIYLKKMPSAFYVDFGDFHWFKMTNLSKVHFTTALRIGTGRSGSITRDKYLETQVDPVAQFSISFANHMNASHQKDNMALAEAETGFELKTAKFLRLDRLGIDLECTHATMPYFVCRVPFLSPANDRVEARERIVEVTSQAHEKTGRKYVKQGKH